MPDGETNGVAEFFSSIEQTVRGVFADAVRDGRASIEVDRPSSDRMQETGLGSPPPELHEIRVMPVNSNSARLAVYSYFRKEVHFIVGPHELWWDVWSDDPRDHLQSIRQIAIAVRDGGFTEYVRTGKGGRLSIKGEFDTRIPGEEPKIIMSNWLFNQRGAELFEYEPY